ncbi:hypothetical protein C8R45DRAFT_927012 [Mycena sanguinolenta]|nr:hypothetical protein C8R45DRAFT_927012 [Mycena sanguinolenta]
MPGEATTSLNIIQYISGVDNMCGGKDNYLFYTGGTGGCGREGCNHGYGGSRGHGEGNTFTYNIMAGQFTMNDQKSGLSNGLINSPIHAFLFLLKECMKVNKGQASHDICMEHSFHGPP